MMWVGMFGAELAEELAKLPDSLTSLYPDVGADFLYSVFKDCVDDGGEKSKGGEAVSKRTRGQVEKDVEVSKKDLNEKSRGEDGGDGGGKHVDFCIDGEKLAEAKKYKDKVLSYARDLEKNSIPVYSVNFWEEKRKKETGDDGGRAESGVLSKCAICGKVVMVEYQGMHRRYCREKEVEKSKSNESSSSSSSSESSSSESSSSSSSSESSSESESSDSDDEAAGLKMQNQIKSRFYMADGKTVPVSAGRSSVPAYNGKKKRPQKRQALTAKGGGPSKKVAKVSSKPAVGVCAPMQNPMTSEVSRDLSGQVYHPAQGNDAGMGRVPQQHVYGQYNAFPQQQMGAQGIQTSYGLAVPAMSYQNNAYQVANSMNLTPQQMQILAQYRYQQLLMQKQHGIAMGSPNLMVPQTGQYQVYGVQPNATSGVISGYNPMQQNSPYAPWPHLPRTNVSAQNGMPANFIPQQPVDSMTRAAPVAATTTGYPFPTTSPMGIPSMFPGSGGQSSQPGASSEDAWWEKQ